KACKLSIDRRISSATAVNCRGLASFLFVLLYQHGRDVRESPPGEPDLTESHIRLIVFRRSFVLPSPGKVDLFTILGEEIAPHLLSVRSLIHNSPYFSFCIKGLGPVLSLRYPSAIPILSDLKVIVPDLLLTSSSNCHRLTFPEQSHRRGCGDSTPDVSL